MIDREKLLAERDELVAKVKTLKETPLTSKSAAVAQFRADDLNTLAKKILGIDRKLGRI